MLPFPDSNVYYAAFLRGINVGGNKILKMEDLRRALASLGFKNVKTLLASGNVVFETAEPQASVVGEKIEKKLKTAFGTDIGVLVRKISELSRLVETDPFKGVKVTPQTRLYVTFLSEKPKSRLKVPFESSDKDFKILSVTDHEVCCALTLTPKSGTLDLMGFIEKEFGRKVTTRNWNTIIKVMKAVE